MTNMDAHNRLIILRSQLCDIIGNFEIYFPNPVKGEIAILTRLWNLFKLIENTLNNFQITIKSLINRADNVNVS